MSKRLILLLLVSLLWGENWILFAQEKAGEGKVTLIIQPFGAEIRVDGELIGSSPLESVPLSAGEHELRIRYPGYQEFSTRVTVEEGKSTVLRGFLKSLVSEEAPVPRRTFPVPVPEPLAQVSAKRYYRLGALTLSGLSWASAAVLYFLGTRTGDDYSQVVDNWDTCSADPDCAASSDLDRYESEAKDAKRDFYRYQNGYYVSLGLGGVFLGAAIYLYLVDYYSPHPSMPARRFSLLPEARINSSGELEGMTVSASIRF